MYSNPHYPRKYEVIISDDKGNALNVSQLRCSFAIRKRPIQSVNFGQITIWNLAEQAMESIIQQGSKIIVNAGYETGDYGQIFSGNIFQPLYERENVTDFKLILHCMDGDSLLHGNFANYSLSAGYTYRDAIIKMCKLSHHPIPIGTITNNLASQKAPRGMTFSGDPWMGLQAIAKDNNATAHLLDGKLEVQKIDDTPSPDVIIVSPESGLIGTPQQIDYGFSFRSLLTPRIKLSNPFVQVKIDNAIIRQQKAMPGRQQIISMLDHDMMGIVVETTYLGDTRGDEWYVDALVVNRGGKTALGVAGMPEMVAGPAMNPWE